MNDLRDPRTLALRNAGVASTVHRNQGEAIMANKAANARVAGVQAAIGTQMHDAQQADTARYQSDNSLAGTQEQASASRYSTDAQAATAQQRNAVDMQRARFEGAKAGQEMTARGFDIRAAAQQEQLRNQIAQEKDPAKRQSVVQRMREMQGTQQADPYLVVPGGQQIDPTSQRAYNTPASVFNRQTGQWVQQPGQGGAAIPQAGAVQGGYRFNGGDPSKQTSWEKV